MRRSFLATASVGFMLGGWGCAHPSVKKAAGPEPQSSVNADSGESALAQNGEPSMRDNLPQSIPELRTVHFVYDSSTLDSEARDILFRNAAWLKSHPEIKVQVAGDCDQRGTVEYNLALGQRRAQSVRAYYKMLGVSGRRIATISYGKEKPLCADMEESCWSRNRRADTLEALPRTVGSAGKGDIRR